MNRCDELAVLIIDDQEDVLETYQEVLGDLLKHNVECVHSPGEALRHVANRLFDIVLIDAKITYKGAGLGGLILAEEIGAVVGIDSIILMSQYDVRNDIHHFNSAYTFLPKPRDGRNFVDWVLKTLLSKIKDLVERQYGFVAMPYGHEKTDAFYRDRLVPWMREAGFNIRRMDEIPGVRPINHELMDRIRHSHFVVLYADTENANVYFEAGFACASQKYLIVVTPNVDSLPFDIRANRALSLGGVDENAERRELVNFMGGLRGTRR